MIFVQEVVPTQGVNVFLERLMSFTLYHGEKSIQVLRVFLCVEHTLLRARGLAWRLE